ncbi:MAG TPA: hypothetical protein VFZ32_01035 [Micromonosporaceae bacterium]
MSDEYAVGNEDGLPPDLADVRDAIAREMYAQICLRNEVIQQEDIPGVAYAVTVMLDRAGTLRKRGPQPPVLPAVPADEGDPSPTRPRTAMPSA